MLRTGIEPVPPCGDGILSPTRLPIPPSEHILEKVRIVYLIENVGVEPTIRVLQTRPLTTWVIDLLMVEHPGYAPGPAVFQTAASTKLACIP